MRTTAALLLIVSLFLTGCESPGPSDTAPSPTATGTPPTPTTATTAPLETVSVGYAWEVGDILTYDLEVHRRVVLATDGSPEAPLDDLPASAEVTLMAAGLVDFEVAELTETGGARLVVAGTLDVTSVEGTVDDEPVEDASGLSALGDLLAMPEEVLVDGTGVVGTGDRSPLARLVPDPLTAWTGFLGPVLPDEEVIVGEEWSRRLDQPAGPGREARGRVAGTEAVDGREVAALVGESAVPAHEVDLSGFYRDFLAAFGPPDGEVEPRLVLAHDPRQERWEARFDPERESLVTSDASATTSTQVEGVAPDRDTGEEVAFEIGVQIEDGLTARSVAAPES